MPSAAQDVRSFRERRRDIGGLNGRINGSEIRDPDKANGI
jgi:hypothetical protein